MEFATISVKNDVSIELIEQSLSSFFGKKLEDGFVYIMGCKISVLDVSDDLAMTKKIMQTQQLEEEGILHTILDDVYQYGKVIYFEIVEDYVPYKSYYFFMANLIGTFLSRELQTETILEFSSNGNIEYCVYDSGEIKIDLSSTHQDYFAELSEQLPPPFNIYLHAAK